jgi:hypothetical protein
VPLSLVKSEEIRKALQTIRDPSVKSLLKRILWDTGAYSEDVCIHIFRIAVEKRDLDLAFRAYSKVSSDLLADMACDLMENPSFSKESIAKAFWNVKPQYLKSNYYGRVWNSIEKRGIQLPKDRFVPDDPRSKAIITMIAKHYNVLLQPTYRNRHSHARTFRASVLGINIAIEERRIVMGDLIDIENIFGDWRISGSVQYIGKRKRTIWKQSPKEVSNPEEVRIFDIVELLVRMLKASGIKLRQKGKSWTDDNERITELSLFKNMRWVMEHKPELEYEFLA